MNKKLNFSFPVTIFGEMEKYNDTISKARCRIFYKYGNRNRTYITDEVAEMLLASIPYAPIKGIYETDDFTDHGEERQEGRIYGVVSGEPNVKWEEVTDDDGVTRTYATVDVLLYTALYKEANEIIGKPQSMELYSPATTGEWKKIDGVEYYVFSQAKFLGLQVLGDTVEPCFEGASFYSLFPEFYEQFSQLFQLIKETNQKEGNKTMLKFKLSDDEKYSLIWSALNTNYTEEGGWLVEYSICAIYDEYALVAATETGKFERVYYTKSEDTVELGERQECFIVDVNTSEKEALDSIRAKNGDTYENSDEVFDKGTSYDADIEARDNTIQEKDGIIAEKDGEISTLQSEKADVASQLETAQTELNQLQEYKKSSEDVKKKAIIEKYEAKLGEEVCEEYSKVLDDYTVDSLEKELAYCYVQANETDVFGVVGGAKVPKEQPIEGLAAVLEQFK